MPRNYITHTHQKTCSFQISRNYWEGKYELGKTCITKTEQSIDNNTTF
jgi:hypothetical protein